MRSSAPGFLPFAITAALLVGLGSPALATNFAVLLKGGDGGDREPVTIKNPHYEEGGASGTNPLYEPSALVLWPDQFVGSRDVLLEVTFQESITEDLPPIPGDGYAFEINLSDSETGDPITRFASPFEIGLLVPKLDHLHSEGIVHRDIATRTLDVSGPTPVWRVEDKEIKTCDSDKFCGKTDHLSIFSFGAIPEPSSLLLAALSSSVLAHRRTRATPR